MFTLAQLRCFVAVVEELNFRRAATRLGMTQPPLSRQIQGLEHAVGALLLDRGGRAVRLTPAGTHFARSARRLLEEAAEAARDARRITEGDAGSLTIAFTAASSYVFLPGLVSALRTHLPAVDLTLREMATPQQLAALQAQQIDFGLLRPPVSLSGVQTRRVYRENLVLAVPAGHKLAAQPEVALRELSGEMLITYPPVEGPYFHRLVTGLLNVAGVVPGGVQHITQTHSIMALVGAGLGVALVPQSAGRFAPPEVLLRPLALKEAVFADLMLAWRTDAENPACEAVLDLLRRGETAPSS